MTKLTWDDLEARTFEAGIDRGVLYHPSGGATPWNGLVNLVEAAASSTSPVYYDGRKINDIVTSSSFTGRLRAITYPEEFLPYEGLVEDSAGLLIAEQPLRRFHLSYRTLLGNHSDGVDAGYKIHILYDLTAVPIDRSYSTLTISTEPLEFEWLISAIPKDLSGFRPTSHIIIDTRKIPSWFLADIEDILYGSDETDPFLPSLESLASYLRGWDRILIIYNGDGTWTAATTREDAIIDLGNGEFQINDANATFIDANTYEISSTDKSEGELWQQ